MNVLLDTCAVLALARGDLPGPATVALQSAPEALVSTVSAWEVGLKVAAGKLRLQTTPIDWFRAVLDRYELREIQLDSRLACAAAALTPLHRDPFDRVLIALAQAQSLLVLTSDDQIPRYPDVRTVWQ